MRRGTTQSRGSGRSRGVSEAARSLLPREVSRGDFLRFGGLGSLSLGGLWLNQQMAAAGVGWLHCEPAFSCFIMVVPVIWTRTT